MLPDTGGREAIASRSRLERRNNIPAIGGVDSFLAIHPGQGTPHDACESEFLLFAAKAAFKPLKGFTWQKPDSLENLKQSMSDAFERDLFKATTGKGVGLGVSLADTQDQGRRVGASPVTGIANQLEWTGFLTTRRDALPASVTRHRSMCYTIHSQHHFITIGHGLRFGGCHCSAKRPTLSCVGHPS